MIQLCIKKLYPREEYHVDLLSQYSIDHRLLSSIFLSPRGFNSEANTIAICNQCSSAMRKKSAKDVPPKFAIANGFAVGLLPQHLWDKCTPVHFRVTAKKTLAASRLVISGGPHGHLNGHVSIFDNKMSTAAEKLPRLFNGNYPEELYVVFAGSNADRAKLLALRRNLCDSETCLQLLDTYRSRRPDYTEVRLFSFCLLFHLF